MKSDKQLRIGIDIFHTNDGKYTDKNRKTIHYYWIHSKVVQIAIVLISLLGYHQAVAFRNIFRTLLSRVLFNYVFAWRIQKNVDIVAAL